MRILDWNSLDRPASQAALARPQVQVRAEGTRVAAELVDQVRRDGDAALKTLTQRFDAAEIKCLAVVRNDFAEARRALTDEQIVALERAIANVQRFHELQLPNPRVVDIEDRGALRGAHPAHRERGALRSGRHGAAPVHGDHAGGAGPHRRVVPRVCFCTPPLTGRHCLHPAVLAAAQLCGIDSVFKVGGAQAIAALAYGTESIPRVDKIFGPGNSWVTAAKALVANDPEGAACDLPAGPSEVLVVADQTAQAELVAADLLAQAEHDPLAQAILVTDSHPLAKRVAREIRTQRQALSRGQILTQSLLACRAIVVPDLDTALQVANEFAPEHLILQVKEPRRYLAHVQNAGAVFLGPWSAEPLGDYCSGPNHVLPTDGHARSFSGLSVRDFVKTLTVQEISPAGLAALGPTAVTLAKLEGLDAHAQAVTRRLVALKAQSRNSAFERGATTCRGAV